MPRHADASSEQAAEDEAFQTVKQVAAASILLYLCTSPRSVGDPQDSTADRIRARYSALRHRLREEACVEEEEGEALNAGWMSEHQAYARRGGDVACRRRWDERGCTMGTRGEGLS